MTPPAVAAPGRGPAERHALVQSIRITAVLAALGVVRASPSARRSSCSTASTPSSASAFRGCCSRPRPWAASGPSPRYPFGRDGATPLVIGIQGVGLLATLGYAAVEGVFAIADGGSDIDAAWAFTYAVVTTGASIVTTAGAVRGAASGSDLVEAETTAWRVAAVRGVGMTGGFGLMWLL